jgi:hypothetical protein
MDTNSAMWTPTTHEFLLKIAKTRQSGEKIREEKMLKRVKFPSFCPIDLSNSDSYRTIGSPM